MAGCILISFFIGIFISLLIRTRNSNDSCYKPAGTLNIYTKTDGTYTTSIDFNKPVNNILKTNNIVSLNLKSYPDDTREVG